MLLLCSLGLPDSNRWATALGSDEAVVSSIGTRDDRSAGALATGGGLDTRDGSKGSSQAKDWRTATDWRSALDLSKRIEPQTAQASLQVSRFSWLCACATREHVESSGRMDLLIAAIVGFLV